MTLTGRKHDRFPSAIINWWNMGARAARGLLTGFDGSNYNTGKVDSDGHLHVDVASVAGTVTVDGSGVTQPVSGTVTVNELLQGSGTRDTFGKLVTCSFINQVDVQFFRDTPGNLVTVTTGGTGGTPASASSSAGGALFSTGTATNGSAKGVSATTTRYFSGAEVYAEFTAAWLNGGAASSYQRIGLYDTNNGFFLGYEGTTFGVTVRKAGSDTQVAQASFSEDPLDGSAGSAYTRAGSPEALDLTKINIWRIRFGWLGAAVVSWEVMAPDGHWVLFHKTLTPNLAAAAHIEDPDLPVTLDIARTGGTSGTLQLLTFCWGAGCTNALAPLTETLTDDTLAALTRSVITGVTTGGGGGYVNVKVNPSGALTVEASGEVGVTSLPGTVQADIGSIKTSVQLIDDAIDGTEMQVDIVGSLPAGTNAIGKLAANSGVDIGDVDVTSTPATEATYTHQRTAAASLTSSTYATFITNSNPIKVLHLYNTTEREIYISFSPSTDHYVLPARSTLVIDYKQNESQESSNISYKNDGTTPTQGALIGTVIT